MKIAPVRHVILVVTVLSAALSVRADAASHAEIVKERDSVLSQILAECEARRPTGTANEDDIAAAQIALYSFRRDVAATTTEKIKNQELIAAIHEKKLEYMKAKMHIGLVSKIQVLEATNSSLEAKQVLEELRLNEKKV
jgi:outer membrane protein TolC